MVTVVVAHRCGVVRQALADLLNESGLFSVVGVAGARLETALALLNCRPEVVVLGLSLTHDEQRELSLMARCSSPSARVLVLSHRGGRFYVRDSFRGTPEAPLSSENMGAALVDAMVKLAT